MIKEIAQKVHFKKLQFLGHTQNIYITMNTLSPFSTIKHTLSGNFTAGCQPLCGLRCFSTQLPEAAINSLGCATTQTKNLASYLSSLSPRSYSQTTPRNSDLVNQKKRENTISLRDRDILLAFVILTPLIPLSNIIY